MKTPVHTGQPPRAHYTAHVRARNAILTRIEERWVAWYHSRWRAAKLSDVREAAKLVVGPLLPSERLSRAKGISANQIHRWMCEAAEVMARAKSVRETSR